jgi:putative endonuclease
MAMSANLGVAVGPVHERVERQRELARQGERLAAEYLERRGCTLLARNWRCREGELDIVGYDGTSVIVCEVKTRSGLRCGAPAESVTSSKIARIRRAASKWLSTFGVPPVPVRFDVVAVILAPGQRPRIRHIPGAF